MTSVPDETLDRPGFRERIAVVTGGNRGIGAAIAGELSRQGARVFVLDREPVRDVDRLDVEYVSCDVSDQGSVDAAFRTVEQSAGAPAILVNNAGILRQQPFEEQRLADWNAMISVNLTGTMLCCLRALPSMRAMESARIVCISSSAAHAGGSPGLAGYAASKAGVSALVKSLAREYAPHGVTVNAVSPAAIATEMVAGMNTFTGAQLVPVGRVGQPADVAAAVAFLCSDTAAFITGEVLDVTGGFLIH